MTDAEQICVSRGGHLVSVGSQKDQVDLVNLTKSNSQSNIWLGGKLKTGKEGWQWLDGRPWGYQRWSSRPCSTCKCVRLLSVGLWMRTKCDNAYSFICTNPVLNGSGDSTVFIRNPFPHNPTYHFWWNHTLERKDQPGFKITWWIENGSRSDVREFVSKDLQGSVSTPGLGSLPPPNYYKAGWHKVREPGNRVP